MDIQHVMQHRRTVHQFTSEPVDPDAIVRALQAACWAPCHRLTWPWRFTVVGPKLREDILTLATSVSAAKKAVSTEKMAPIIRSKLGRSGGFIIPRQVLSPDPHTRDEDHATVAMAIQNLCLSLFAEGIYTKWSTTSTVESDKLYQLMNLDPASERILGFLLIGHPERVPNPPARPPMEQWVDYTD